MLALGELIRTAGNSLLVPVKLSELTGTESWRRGLLVGSLDDRVLAKVGLQLQVVAPQLSLLSLETLADGTPGLREVRRRRYDFVCLVLTGEGRSREKTLAMLSGARVVLAVGKDGEWYRAERPAVRPFSPRWWMRLLLVGLLSFCYLLAMELVLFSDLFWRFLPMSPAVRDPGPPEGRRVTFVMPTYNQRNLMDQCLPPLLAEAGDEHEIILVDDCGSDGTAEYVREAYPAVRVIRLAQNSGFAAAVRTGIAASTTPLFALINDDAIVQPGFLEHLLPYFDRPEVFAVCSQIELPGGSQVETGRVLPAFSGILEPYHVAPSEPGPILYAGGASSIYHRARYEALGGLETFYRPIYWEDIELGYAAWRRGWRSLFEPGALVLHQRRATMGARFSDWYNNQTFLKNAILFTWKNFRDRGLLTQHFVYVIARLLREVLAGENMMAGAVLRALPELPRAVWKRWRARRPGDLSDREVLSLLGTLPDASPRTAETCLTWLAKVEEAAQPDAPRDGPAACLTPTAPREEEEGLA